jgi:ArsR family transcriptional regulator
MKKTKFIKTSNLLRAIGNENRLKLIYCLSKPHSVTEMLSKCHLSQSALSQHLKILKECGIVDCNREGKLQIYKVENMKIIELAKKILEIK